MNELLVDADVCVKCGLCLPTCPTYGKTQNENESPRGRIALIQAWAEGQLGDSKAIRTHVDNCLLCGECERVCPAVVPYSRLIDNFRSRFYQQAKPSLAFSILKKITQDKNTQGKAWSLLKFYQTTPLQKTARFLKLPQLFAFDKAERLLTHYSEPIKLQEHYLAVGESQGTIGLFIGCMGSLLDAETVHAAIKVLTAVGFDVFIPNAQTCCGALALHSGDKANAEHLARINTEAFNKPLTAVVTIASGCGSQLQTYVDKVMDISQFLANYTLPNLQPLVASVYLHTPCSLKNTMRAGQGALQLLQCIPDLTITPLPKSIVCCGSAGSYMLEHSAMANELLADVLNVASTVQADYLVTSNIGCALHITAGLQERGIKMTVIHPIVLIAQQLL